MVHLKLWIKSGFKTLLSDRIYRGDFVMSKKDIAVNYWKMSIKENLKEHYI